MRMRKAVQTDTYTAPETRSDLHQWVRDRMPLSTSHEQALLDAIDHVFMQHERLWQNSKQEAIQAVSAGFTERLNRLREELSARDATVSSISHYFEDLVADLTDRVHRDPKTRLDELPPLRRAARGVPRARTARPLVRGRPRRYHVVQVVQRHARPRARRQDHRSRGAAAAGTGPRRRPDRAGACRVAHRPGAARTLRRRRVLFPDSRSRRVQRGVGDRRALPRGGRSATTGLPRIPA